MALGKSLNVVAERIIELDCPGADSSAHTARTRARTIESLIAKAVSQIPAGEAWFLYIGWIDSHRPTVSDLRTEEVFRVIEAVSGGHEALRFKVW